MILICSTCLDRISFDIDKPTITGIVVEGYISDQPGPYEVRVTNAFDIESIESQKVYVSAKRLSIYSNQGDTEDLDQVDVGIYQTKPDGIRGVAGGVYTLRIELFDGRIYESLPDTIIAAGKMDSVYLEYKSEYNSIGVKEYSCDIFFNASYDPSINDRFIWKFTGTFQAETHPEMHPPDNCFYLERIQGCNFLPPCSGLLNIARPAYPPAYKRIEDCSCCTCWYNLLNPFPILSDDRLSTGGRISDVKAHNIPLNSWTLMHKIRLEVSQRSLTHQSFRFWKAIKHQQEAIGSLFQPVSGIIPSNFVQVQGKTATIDGLFFATSVSSIVKYIDRYDLPVDIRFKVSLDTPIYADDCRKLFPGSSNRKPAFWLN